MPVPLFSLLLAAPVLLLMGGVAGAAYPEPWQLGFQPPATPVMERIASFHDLLLWIITLISIFVLALLAYVCVRFRASRSATPSRRTHNTVLEIAWTAVPVLILVVIAIPSFKLLYFQDVVPEADLTIKATGHQWYWSYEYPDNGEFAFDAYMVADADLEPGQLRLLTTDNRVVLPVQTDVRVLVTATDVLHSWAVPAPPARLDPRRRKNAGTSNQKLMLFMRGKAMSGAPIISGTNQLPNPPISAGMTTKNTMIRPCAVTRTLKI